MMRGKQHTADDQVWRILGVGLYKLLVDLDSLQVAKTSRWSAQVPSHAFDLCASLRYPSRQHTVPDRQSLRG